MRREDRRVGFGWSKTKKQEFKNMFGVDIEIEYFDSLLIRSLLVYVENNGPVFTVENISINHMCELVKKSLKDGKNYLKERLEGCKKKCEFIKQQAVERVELLNN